MQSTPIVSRGVRAAEVKDLLGDLVRRGVVREADFGPLSLWQQREILRGLDDFARAVPGVFERYPIGVFAAAVGTDGGEAPEWYAVYAGGDTEEPAIRIDTRYFNSEGRYLKEVDGVITSEVSLAFPGHSSHVSDLYAVTWHEATHHALGQLSPAGRQHIDTAQRRAFGHPQAPFPESAGEIRALVKERLWKGAAKNGDELCCAESEAVAYGFDIREAREFFDALTDVYGPSLERRAAVERRYGRLTRALTDATSVPVAVSPVVVGRHTTWYTHYSRSLNFTTTRALCIATEQGTLYTLTPEVLTNVSASAAAGIPVQLPVRGLELQIQPGAPMAVSQDAESWFDDRSPIAEWVGIGTGIRHEPWVVPDEAEGKMTDLVQRVDVALLGLLPELAADKWKDGKRTVVLVPHNSDYAGYASSPFVTRVTFKSEDEASLQIATSGRVAHRSSSGWLATGQLSSNASLLTTHATPEGTVEVSLNNGTVLSVTDVTRIEIELETSLSDETIVAVAHRRRVPSVSEQIAANLKAEIAHLRNAEFRDRFESRMDVAISTAHTATVSESGERASRECVMFIRTKNGSVLRNDGSVILDVTASQRAGTLVYREGGIEDSDVDVALAVLSTTPKDVAQVLHGSKGNYVSMVQEAQIAAYRLEGHALARTQRAHEVAVCIPVPQSIAVADLLARPFADSVVVTTDESTITWDRNGCALMGDEVLSYFDAHMSARLIAEGADFTIDAFGGPKTFHNVRDVRVIEAPPLGQECIDALIEGKEIPDLGRSLIDAAQAMATRLEGHVSALTVSTGLTL